MKGIFREAFNSPTTLKFCEICAIFIHHRAVIVIVSSSVACRVSGASDCLDIVEMNEEVVKSITQNFSRFLGGESKVTSREFVEVLKSCEKL